MFESRMASLGTFKLKSSKALGHSHSFCFNRSKNLETFDKVLVTQDETEQKQYHG